MCNLHEPLDLTRLIGEIQHEVTRYLGDPEKDGIKFTPCDPKQFEAAVKHLGRTLRRADDLQFRLIAALCLLGPNHLTLPPRIYAQVLQLLQWYVTDTEEQKDRLKEFVVAFGCGRWRRVKGDSPGWDGRWPGAVRALARALFPAVREARLWLGRVLNLDLSRAEDVWSDAHELAMYLIHGEKVHTLKSGCSVMIHAALDGARVELSDESYDSDIQPGAKFVATLQGDRFVLEIRGKKVLLPGGTKLVVSVYDEEIRLDLVEHDFILGAGETATMAVTALRVPEAVAKESGLRRRNLRFPQGEEATIRVGGHNTTVSVAGKEYVLRKGQTAAPSGSRLVAQGEDIPIPGGAKTVLKEEGGRIRLRVERRFTLKAGEEALISGGGAGAALAVWHCTCGTLRCAELHRLSSWDESYPLWAFLAAAAKGIAVKRKVRGRRAPSIGSFVQGIVFALLNSRSFAAVGPGGRVLQVRLRYGSVAYNLCPKGHKYLGTKCGVCGRPQDSSTRRIAAPGLFFVGEGSPFRRERFFKCNGCENLSVPEDLIEKECTCDQCSEPLFQIQEVRQILGTSGGGQAIAPPAFMRLRAARNDLAARSHPCPRCGKAVAKRRCHNCGSDKVSQREVFAWVYE
jgi:hypothetical protein